MGIEVDTKTTYTPETEVEDDTKTTRTPETEVEDDSKTTESFEKDNKVNGTPQKKEEVETPEKKEEVHTKKTEELEKMEVETSSETIGMKRADNDTKAVTPQKQVEAEPDAETTKNDM